VNICMIGAGYVGLVSAACFSEFGWKVACTDKDAERIEQSRPLSKRKRWIVVSGPGEAAAGRRPAAAAAPAPAGDEAGGAL